MMRKNLSANALFLSLLMTGGPLFASAENMPSIEKTKATLYTNMVDQSVYYEATNMLRLDRLYRKLFNKKINSQDINVFDQVPDSTFFENRHARAPLSPEALERGASENDGPSPEGLITVIKGKAEGMHPGFFIMDTRGDRYLLKFDSFMNLELNTAAEVIASRFYHAIGYHVPQYTIFTFDSERLIPGANATMTDRNGFKQPLTQELLHLYTVQLPRDNEGRLRASASKLLPGENKGPFNFQGRRKDDPDDTLNHERRRTIRALWVFAAWLNNNDVRHSNTLDMLVTENGRSYLKHYLIDFNATLGGAAGGAKPPMFTHNYFIDYGEVSKNFFALGFRKPVWQKRLEEKKTREEPSPAVGYIDNIRFSPEDYKVQLPYYAFKDLTRADGFWAAKIIMSFTDDDIKAMIRAGLLSREEDAQTLFEILSERRDAIGRAWFAQATPLSNFRLAGSKLSFSDLEVTHNFVSSEGSIYLADILQADGKKTTTLDSLESALPEFQIPEELLNSSAPFTLQIRVKRPAEKKSRPHVRVEITAGSITRILHQD